MKTGRFWIEHLAPLLDVSYILCELKPLIDYVVLLLICSAAYELGYVFCPVYIFRKTKMLTHFFFSCYSQEYIKYMSDKNSSHYPVKTIYSLNHTNLTRVLITDQPGTVSIANSVFKVWIHNIFSVVMHKRKNKKEVDGINVTVFSSHTVVNVFIASWNYPGKLASFE